MRAIQEGSDQERAAGVMASGYIDFEAGRARPLPEPSLHAREVLETLRDYHNGFMMGPPSSGKSMLLDEDRRATYP